MYHRHFGLREAPFGITPDPNYFYSGNTRGDLLEALRYAVERGEGILKVTGEVGSGKTMLCRMLEASLAPHIDVIFLANPSLHPREVAGALAGELGLEMQGLRIDAVQRRLQAELIARHAAGRQVVLLVEEAQAMPLATLEGLRLLSNLETSRHKLLQIVLFGQPELDQHLDLPQMRQLKERVTHSFVVPAMPPALVPEFLAFRLRAAGYHGPAVFTAPAARRIARVSGGLVRRINILADKALMAAYADDARQVEARHARAAIRDCAYGARGRIALPAALLLILLGGTLWLVLGP